MLHDKVASKDAEAIPKPVIDSVLVNAIFFKMLPEDLRQEINNLLTTDSPKNYEKCIIKLEKLSQYCSAQANVVRLWQQAVIAKREKEHLGLIQDTARQVKAISGNSTDIVCQILRAAGFTEEQIRQVADDL